MSNSFSHNAVQVDPEHIHVLVWAGLWLADAQDGEPLFWVVLDDDGRVAELPRLTPHTADAVGQMLLDTNTRAVNDDTGRDDLYIYSYREPTSREWNQLEILKAVQFYEHQNIILDDWHRCPAYYFCKVLTSRMLYQLPGFLSAPGHITATTLPAALRPF